VGGGKKASRPAASVAREEGGSSAPRDVPDPKGSSREKIFEKENPGTPIRATPSSQDRRRRPPRQQVSDVQNATCWDGRAPRKRETELLRAKRAVVQSEEGLKRRPTQGRQVEASGRWSGVENDVFGKPSADANDRKEPAEAPKGGRNDPSFDGGGSRTVDRDARIGMKKREKGPFPVFKGRKTNLFLERMFKEPTKGGRGAPCPGH